MLKPKPKKQNQLPLATRITLLEQECNEYLDAKAQEQRGDTGIPLVSIRQMLSVRHPNNVFAAVLNLIENEERN
jgi:hypothetical protein